VKKPRTHVTDHALLRYLERVLRVDIEGHRHDLGRIVDQAVAAGAGAVTVHGTRYVLNGPSIVTLHHVKEVRPRRPKRRLDEEGRDE
jgi:hypothetical protein